MLAHPEYIKYSTIKNLIETADKITSRQHLNDELQVKFSVVTRENGYETCCTHRPFRTTHYKNGDFEISFITEKLTSDICTAVKCSELPLNAIPISPANLKKISVRSRIYDN